MTFISSSFAGLSQFSISDIVNLDLSSIPFVITEGDSCGKGIADLSSSVFMNTEDSRW